MAISTVFNSGQTIDNQEIWQSLKSAIAKSSGFKRWQQEQLPNEAQVNEVQVNEVGDYEEIPYNKSAYGQLDQQVRHYLKETLATLAY
jgi:hypothetical protein